MSKEDYQKFFGLTILEALEVEEIFGKEEAVRWYAGTFAWDEVAPAIQLFGYEIVGGCIEGFTGTVFVSRRILELIDCVLQSIRTGKPSDYALLGRSLKIRPHRDWGGDDVLVFLLDALRAVHQAELAR